MDSAPPGPAVKRGAAKPQTLTLIERARGISRERVPLTAQKCRVPLTASLRYAETGTLRSATGIGDA